MYTNIENSLLFKGLTQEEIERLLLSVSYKEKHFSKNEIIAFSDDEVRELLILVEGSVKGEMVDFSGKTIKIEDIDSPRMLAPAFLYGNNNRFPVNIVANCDCSILSFSKPSFIQLLQLNEKILTNYLNSVSNRAQFLSTKIRFLSFQTIKGKIAHFLLQLSKRNNSELLVMPKSQNELSEMFGVARPSLGRAMRELDAEGIIKAEGKHIKILDKERLSGLLKD